jgi:dTDP-4-dehydrorhamnose reductase
MRPLIIGGSGKIGKIISNKNSIKTYNKNKIQSGKKFNLLKDDINYLIKKYNIDRVVLLSAISDPDECLKKEKYSNLLNVIKKKELIDKLI